MDKAQIIQSLQEWEGRPNNYLAEFYDQYSGTSYFIELIADIFTSESSLEIPTSWLIKYHIDLSRKIEHSKLQLVVNKVDKLENWQSQLHILQIIPKIGLSQKIAGDIENSVFEMLRSENKFVKAAAYGAYFEIVKIYPELQHEFKIMCNRALHKESAAVKVKLKRILKKID